MTRGGGVDSTVHVDVQDHNLDVQDHKAGGHPIRIFDCAGQVRHIMFLIRVELTQSVRLRAGSVCFFICRAVVVLKAGGRDSFMRSGSF